MNDAPPIPTGPRSLGDMRCLVVGAASGIGRATFDLLTGSAAHVIAADRPGVRWPGGRDDSWVPIDVTDEASVRSAVAQAASAAGGLDAVVNTAGVLGAVQPSAAETTEDFEDLLRINLVGAYTLSRAVLPAMAASGFGRLVHFSSTAGKEGVPGMTGYSASKAGVAGMVKALAREYAATGVTVNAIAPGKIHTPLISTHPPTPADLARIPIGRLGTVQEAAALIEYIISPAASYTTGFVFDLSGGRATY